MPCSTVMETIPYKLFSKKKIKLTDFCIKKICLDSAEAELDSAVAELDSKGVVVEPVRIDEHTGKRFTFFADPDGLPLELYER